MLIFGKDGRYLYALLGGGITVLDLSAGSVLKAIAVISSEVGLLDMVLSSDGALLFATDFSNSQLDVICTTTLELQSPIPAPRSPAESCRSQKESS